MPRAETHLKGLTLTEMLAVVAIILILSYMAVGAFVRQLELARVKRAVPRSENLGTCRVPDRPVPCPRTVTYP